MASLNHARSGVALAAVGGALYALNGNTATRAHAAACPRCMVVDGCAPLPRPRSHTHTHTHTHTYTLTHLHTYTLNNTYALTHFRTYTLTHTHTHTHITVGAGSSQEGRSLSVVERYDPINDSWVEVASTSSSRSGLATAVLEGQLYVLVRHCTRS